MDVEFLFGKISTSGIDDTVTTEIHSEYICLDDCDYIDVQMLDDTFSFAIYAFDSETGEYTLYLNDGFVNHGTVRCDNNEYQYVIRIKASDASMLTIENVANAFVITKGTYNYCDSNAAGDCVEGDTVYFSFDAAYFEHAISTSSGYQDASNNAVSAPIPLLNYDGIRFTFTNTDFRYAVYAVDSNGVYTLSSGGWLYAPGVFVGTDTSAAGYIVRVGRSTGSDAFTQEEFDSIISSIEIEHFDQRSTSEEYIADGYTRSYSDISNTLNFENKAIEAGIVVDNTLTLLAELPNYANVEVKMNAPQYGFRIFSYDGTSYTELTNGYSHYWYRYAGDPELQYFVQIAYQAGSTIDSSCGTEAVKCYTYVDSATELESNDGLYGKSIAVIGDSIVQGRFCVNGTTVNTVAEKPWSHIIAEACNTDSANFGIGGARVQNNDWRSLYLNCTNVVGYDVVFVCAGTNDYSGNVSQAKFEAAFRYIIETLMENNTEVVVCTPVYRSNKTAANSQGLYLSDYAEIETQIAEAYGLKVIDLYTLTSTDSFSSTLADGLHPDEEGHKIIADIILKNYGAKSIVGVE